MRAIIYRVITLPPLLCAYGIGLELTYFFWQQNVFQKHVTFSCVKTAIDAHIHALITPIVTIRNISTLLSSVLFFSLFLFFAGGALWHFLSHHINPAPWLQNQQMLFTTGVYRLSRHPMYLSLLLLLLACGCFLQTWITVLSALFFVVFVTPEINREEQWLLQHFAQYRLYQTQTAKWLLLK